MRYYYFTEATKEITKLSHVGLLNLLEYTCKQNGLYFNGLIINDGKLKGFKFN